MGKQIRYILLSLTAILSSWMLSAAQISGTVKDGSGKPVTGASIVLRSNTARGTTSGTDGSFSLAVPDGEEVLEISHISYRRAEASVSDGDKLDIVLEPGEISIEQVVITGYLPKAKNSFTGTATQVSGDDLRDMNPVSILDALKIFDASFSVVDQENLFGSDPNRIPDHIEIRGQNSMPDISEGNLQTYTSLPVFMIDGFQATVQQVYDLDMNRVESVTILKDAAASSIYGSRAANGVIVITTKNPQKGRLRVSYTLNTTIETPDLSSYNLMNSSELLEYYVKAQMFNNGESGSNTATNIYEDLIGGNPGRQNFYMLLSREVENGIDTYWLSQPLRTALRHSHSVLLEGGADIDSEKPDRMLRYQVGLNGDFSEGVMKGSGRDRYGAGVKLIYNSRGLSVSSDISAGFVSYDDSPYGDFSTYTKLLPFYRIKDGDGRYFPVLSYGNAPIYSGFPGKDFTGSMFDEQVNPLYDAAYLSSFSKGETTNLSYKLAVDWEAVTDLRIRTSLSVNHDRDKKESFRSPHSAEYYELGNGTDDAYRKGSYVMANGTTTEYYGGLNLSYVKTLSRHSVQGIAGGELRESRAENDAYTATGFADDPQGYPSQAVHFDPYGGPSGSYSIVRTAGAYAIMNYSFDSRYLFDLTGRVDGSSNYARNKRTSPFWAAGARWNIHNEAFMRGNGIFRNLALRANIGTTGNSNFRLSNITTLYRYANMYDGISGAEIISLPNEDLKWQTTLNRNIGLEVSTRSGLINIEFNYYSNITHDNITEITALPSTGFSTYKANMGDVTNKGVDFTVSVTPVRTSDLRVNVFMNGTRNKNRLKNISGSLKDYNKAVMSAQTDTPYGTTKLQRVFLFEEGSSLRDIYAVRSLGIDPATGKEIFLTRDGEKTNKWEAADQVVVGNTEPTLSGHFGVNIDYRRFSLGTAFAYSFGADRYNSTLYEKMEGNLFTSNGDRRALKDKWEKPGDIAKYRGYTDLSILYPTSRFVQKDNYLAMTSARITYRFSEKATQPLGLSMLRISASSNDIFHISTTKQERGLTYPYARKFHFTLQANF